MAGADNHNCGSDKTGEHARVLWLGYWVSWQSFRYWPPQPVRPPQGNSAWVPGIVGLPEHEARTRIEAAGLENTYVNFQAEADILPKARPFFHSVARGHVLSSQPPAGTEVARGSVVKMAVRKD